MAVGSAQRKWVGSWTRAGAALGTPRCRGQGGPAPGWSRRPGDTHANKRAAWDTALRTLTQGGGVMHWGGHGQPPCSGEIWAKTGQCAGARLQETAEERSSKGMGRSAAGTVSAPAARRQTRLEAADQGTSLCGSWGGPAPGLRLCPRVVVGGGVFPCLKGTHPITGSHPHDLIISPRTYPFTIAGPSAGDVLGTHTFSPRPPGSDTPLVCR